jgi:hypothetical protein
MSPRLRRGLFVEREATDRFRVRAAFSPMLNNES